MRVGPPSSALERHQQSRLTLDLMQHASFCTRVPPLDTPQLFGTKLNAGLASSRQSCSGWPGCCLSRAALCRARMHIAHAPHVAPRAAQLRTLLTVCGRSVFQGWPGGASQCCAPQVGACLGFTAHMGRCVGHTTQQVHSTVHGPVRNCAHAARGCRFVGTYWLAHLREERCQSVHGDARRVRPGLLGQRTSGCPVSAPQIAKLCCGRDVTSVCSRVVGPNCWSPSRLPAVTVAHARLLLVSASVMRQKAALDRGRTTTRRPLGSAAARGQPCIELL